jgi:uncharacterized protein
MEPKPTSDELKTKCERLRETLRKMGKVAIAYSGGLDSSFLAKVAFDVLGEGVLLVTGVSESLPERELEEAKHLAISHGIPHRLVRTKELENPLFSENRKDRCYHCKALLFDKIAEIARQESIPFILDGTNASDEGDYRPGRKAAAEKGVRSPLLEAGLTKDDIRKEAKRLGLPNWKKPSFACLASRFPYGETLTKKKLSQVEQCENILHDLGFAQFRVRCHGDVARIEVEESDTARVFEHREAIVKGFRETGFQFVSLDLEGYKTGSMNRVLKSESPEYGVRGLAPAFQTPDPAHSPKESEGKPSHSKKEPAWMETWKPRTFGAGWATLYVDGGSRQNPGPAAIGFLIYDDSAKELARGSEQIGNATNNVAEYRALLEGLRTAKNLGIKKIVVLSDSQLIVRQVKGTYKVKNQGLLRILSEVQRTRRDFTDFRIEEIPREENTYADYLVEQAFKSKKIPVPPS